MVRVELGVLAGRYGVAGVAPRAVLVLVVAPLVGGRDVRPVREGV